MNTELKYRSFETLLNEVAADFTVYSVEGFIEPSQLIKVAQKVNYDLGLRIHGTKEKLLEIEHRKVKLPDDFYILNYAYLTSSYKVQYRTYAGRETENHIVDDASDFILQCPICNNYDGMCNCADATYVQECQNGENIFVKVVEKRKTETRIYETFDRVRIATDTGRIDALNDSDNVGYIKNGFIYTNISQGKLFISYQGALEDEEGHLLVVDHPMINEYYEYAIKQRLLENLFINGEDVSQKLQLIEQRLRAARNNALSIVNTPNFAEMYKLWQLNRKAQYHKYYDMFRSTEPLINIYQNKGRVVEDECKKDAACPTGTITPPTPAPPAPPVPPTPPAVTFYLLAANGNKLITQDNNNIIVQ